MLRHPVLLSLVLLLAGCTGSTFTASNGTGDTAAKATVASGAESESGASDLDVDITLPEPPPVVPGVTTADVELVFEILNRGESPATIKRIHVSGVSGSYDVETWSRKYTTTIAPGAKEKLPFIARVSNLDSTIGMGPATVRAQIEYENANGKQKAAFVRRIGAAVGVGVTKTP